MKQKLRTLFLSAIAFVCLLFPLSGCGQSDDGAKNYTLTEYTFFRVMTNMLYYPEQYLSSTIEGDFFVYEITDALDGTEYVCGVRKCSSGYGCTCGQDTIIGFILEYDGEIPAAKNQSEDTSDKTWIHVKGSLVSADKTYINVYAYADGVQTENTEQIYMYKFSVQSLTEIDGSDLAYYVTK